MKIISGYLKGRKIYGFDINGTRPTMDRVKESLFAMIQDYISDSICLDLFSGSGNLGIEAISEGAKYSYLVDNNKESICVIKKNIIDLKIDDKVEILNMDYKNAIEKITKKVDLIFLDPPYKTDYIEEAIKLIDKYQILNDNGLIICESSNLAKIIYGNNYEAIKSKKYGDKWVVIIKKIC